jgi:uncharacterized membrane protein
VRTYLCPQCDAELAEGARFCQHCGVAIDWDAVPQREQYVAEAAPAPQQEQVAVAEAEAIVAPEPLPLPENLAAVVSFATIIPAVIFLYVEPFRRNQFVRFHAVQHLLLFGVAVVSAIAASILWMVLQLIPFMRVLVFPFAGLIGLAWLFLWLLLVVKAYRHEWFKLPWIGDLAEELSRK